MHATLLIPSCAKPFYTPALTAESKSAPCRIYPDVPAWGPPDRSPWLCTAALHAHKREQVPIQDLAEEAHYVEAGRAAQPAGKHDHYLGAFGGLTTLEIDPSGKVEVAPLPISAHVAEELPNSLVVFFTGIQRESADILAQQDRDTKAGDSAVIDGLHEIKQIGYDIRDALVEGDLRPLWTPDASPLANQEKALGENDQHPYRSLVRARH